jgi:hypothetical protein
MQTSGKCSIPSGPRADRVTKVAGLGLVVTFFLMAAGAGTSCSPGSINPEDFAGAGGGSGAGGSGGSTPPIAGMGPTAATAVEGCSKFKTLGEGDAFLKMRCGFNPVCHGSGAIWTDMTKQDLWKLLLNVAPKVGCMGGSAKLIDGADWSKSFILVKAQQMVPACPSGGSAPGTVMPPPEMSQGQTPKAPPLAADEVTCLGNYAKAAAGK